MLPGINTTLATVSRHVQYVYPPKVAAWLVSEEGGGGEWGQLAKAVETIPRRPTVRSPRGAFTIL